MATKKSKAPAADLASAKVSLGDDPYRAWQLASGIDKPDAAIALDVQRVVVKALELIVSDLDEHGEDNLDMYGGGKHSEDDFKDLLKRAKATLRDLEHPAPASALPALPTIAGTPALGTPKPIATKGTRPVVVAGNWFVAREDKQLVLRDLAGAIVRTLDDEYDAKAAEVSPDRTLLAIGVFEKLAVHDVATGAVRWRNDKQKGWVAAIAFSPDGSRIAAGSDGRLMVLDAATGNQVAAIETDAWLQAVAFTSDGTGVVTIYDDKLALRSATDLAVIASVDAELGSEDLFVVAGRAIVLPYNAIAMWDPGTGKELASAKLFAKKIRWASGSRLAISKDGALAALLHVQKPTSSKEHADLQLWRLSPLEMLADVRLADFVIPGSVGEGGIAFTPDGKALVVAGREKTLLVPIV